MRVQFEFDKCIMCLEQPACSWEHVIPRSLGGRLQLRCLCKRCNNRLGSGFVSQLRSDPSVRACMEMLKDQLPQLYAEAQDGLPFVGKAPDGSVVRASRKKGKWRILGGPGADGSYIQDTRDAAKDIPRILRKGGAAEEQVHACVEAFSKAAEGSALALPGGRTFKKQSMPLLVPDLSGKPVSDRVPASVAYNFLAFMIGRRVYAPAFNPVRDFIRTGASTTAVTVTVKAGGTPAPYHYLYLKPGAASLTVVVRLFQWTRFEVELESGKYTGPDAVYLEDLRQGRSLIAESRSHAMRGEWWEVQ